MYKAFFCGIILPLYSSQALIYMEFKELTKQIIPAKSKTSSKHLWSWCCGSTNTVLNKQTNKKQLLTHVRIPNCYLTPPSVLYSNEDTKKILVQKILVSLPSFKKWSCKAKRTEENSSSLKWQSFKDLGGVLTKDKYLQLIFLMIKCNN